MDAKDFSLSLLDLSGFLGTTPTALLKKIQKIDAKHGSLTTLRPQLVREVLYNEGYRFPQKVISFQMLKGGVAKTTSAMNFGIRAAMYGAQVLFIDLDQQANLSFALGVDTENLPVWVDIVEKKVRIQDALVSVSPGVDLIPSSLNNSVLDRVLLNSNRNWAQSVKAPLSEIRAKYDLVIIDTAPNLSAINTAVTCASDLVILPLNPDKFSLLGAQKHLADLAEIRQEFHLHFENRILFTKFDGRENASREILSRCIELFENLLLNNYIRTSTEIKNTIGSSQTIFSTKSKAKEDYDLVTREILGMESKDANS